MKIDLNILNKYIEDGWIIKNDHPYLDISIYNYSPSAQYENKWDDVIRMCRGLVLDKEGNVVAKPFPKFHNMEEHDPKDIPNEPFDVYEKYDGSLGIVFFYKAEWHVATRGSFISDQAVKGKEFLRKYPIEKLDKNNTYLFEILFESNRIVVDYGDYEGLVLLGAYENETGKEVEFDTLKKLDGFDIARRYNGITDYSILGGMISNDREGYVIRFKSGFRMKIKGQHYVYLHRILTNVSSRDIWDYLANDKPFNELLEKTPDEFNNFVKETILDLQTKFDNIERDYLMIYNDMVKKYPNRKDYAEVAKSYPHSSLLFTMLDKRNYKPIIWKLIYPKYVKPFKKEN